MAGTVETIDHVQRNLDGVLPEHVTCMRQDFIGTSSGNPSSEVIWAFKEQPLDTAPRFVVAQQVVGDWDRQQGLDRRVYAFGPLYESTYQDVMASLHGKAQAFMILYNKLLGRELIKTDMRVPNQLTTERVMSSVVSLILNGNR